jgi:hypothetical protein
VVYNGRFKCNRRIRWFYLDSWRKFRNSQTGPGGAGLQTLALAFGGNLGTGLSAATEEYDGSTWTGGGNLNIARGNSFCGAGTQTAGLAAGGITSAGKTFATELYDGSSWANTANMALARNGLAGCGTQTAGLAFGGQTTAATNATEEYTGSTLVNTPSILTTS